jgi:hypothetical protein
MMFSIYKRATYVYVWLGQLGVRTEAAMQILKSDFRPYHNYKYEVARKSQHLLEGTKKFETSKGGSKPVFRYSTCQTLQELLLAETLNRSGAHVSEIYSHHFGDTLLSWEELRRFCLSGMEILSPEVSTWVPPQVKWLADHALSARTYNFANLLRTFSTS